MNVRAAGVTDLLNCTYLLNVLTYLPTYLLAWDQGDCGYYGELLTYLYTYVTVVIGIIISIHDGSNYNQIAAATASITHAASCGSSMRWRSGTGACCLKNMLVELGVSGVVNESACIPFASLSCNFLEPRHAWCRVFIARLAWLANAR